MSLDRKPTVLILKSIGQRHRSGLQWFLDAETIHGMQEMLAHMDGSNALGKP